jgi:spore germination cell wall hydrolase CwlJ-like protein
MKCLFITFIIFTVINFPVKANETAWPLTMTWPPSADLSCLALNIYHEARSQSIAGQIAVAQVVLNRVDDIRYPNTICEVVLQGPHRPSWKDKTRMYPIRYRCQFTWYCDGKSDIIKDVKAYNNALDVAKLVLNLTFDITSGATHYHAEWVTPSWAKRKTRTTKIEDHIFYRWEKNKSD